MNSILKGTILYDKIDLIGLKAELTHSQNVNFQIIAKHWKIFNSTLHQIKGRSSLSANWIKYGLTYKENEIYYYFASIPYDLKYSCPVKMIKKSIPKGYYALFHHKGKMTEIKKTVSYIFNEAISSNNFNIKNIENFGIIYFEKYGKKFHWNKAYSIIELLVPTKSPISPNQNVE
jgi:predicted transcriptional regulator YdeE